VARGVGGIFIPKSYGEEKIIHWIVADASRYSELAENK
jgi:hypothetical protein